MTPDAYAGPPPARPAPPPAVAAAFRRLRARRGWTQANLAAALGVTKACVNNVERGRRWPSGRVLWAALALGGAADSPGKGGAS